MKTQIITVLLSSLTTLFSLTGITTAKAQPVNDLITNATNLALNPVPYTESNVQFASATNNLDHTSPGNGCQISQAGIWYKFTATKNGNVAAGILNPDGAVVIFFTGPENTNTGLQLVHVDQNTNPCASNPLANIDVVSGTTYFLYMRNLITSDVTINTSGAFQVPHNDLITNASDIGLVEQPLIDEGIHFQVTTATNDGGQTDCTSGNFDGVWYKITPEIDGTINAGMEGSAANESVMIFYSAANENATSGTDLTWVDQPNNTCGINNTASIDAEAGTTYYLFAFSAQPFANVIINASAVLSTPKNVLEGFKIYPNPVTDELNLSAKNNITHISIINLLGQQVYSEKVNTTNKSIDFSSYGTGIYIINITSEGKTANYKVVKK